MKDAPKRNRFFSKTTLSILSAFIVMSSLVGAFTPEPAYAQLAVVRTDPTEILLDQSMKITNKVGKALLAVGLGGLMQGVSHFTRVLAHDTAKWVASGGKGQSALAFQDGFGSYLRDVAGASVGEAIYQLGQPFGFNLCSIPDPQFNVFLNLSIESMQGYVANPGSAINQVGSQFGSQASSQLSNAVGSFVSGGPETNCSWTELRNNWNIDALRDRYRDLSDVELDGVLLNQFVGSLSVERSDFGVAIASLAAVDNARSAAQIASTFDRQEGGGFKPLTELITGDIRTPASVVEEESTKLTATHQSDISAGQIAGVYGSGTLSALTQAGSIFLNTLLGELLNNVLSNGILPSRSGSRNGADVTDAFSGGFVDNRNSIERAFNFLLTATPSRSINAYETELISQFSVCPEFPGVYNCVMDNELFSVIQQSESGDALTIREAIEGGFLSGDKPLIPPDAVQNSQKNCYEIGYCYSNVQKLRKARILPLGFEIAAKNGNPGNLQEVTLQKVVDGFESCNVSGNRDSAHPYCHLIDPNWIIKVPDLVCNSLVYGEIPTSDVSPERQQECADLSSCVQYSENGECLSFGYCTQEANVWNIPGQTCPAEYSTCTTYLNRADGSVNSYLSRTVDFAQCDADTVGCRAYATAQDNGEWIPTKDTDNSLKKFGNNGTRYYTSAIDSKEFSCSPSDVGCTEFELAEELNGDYEGSGEPLYLQAAPAYLTCYDNDQDIDNGITWPTTVAEAEISFASDAACADYSPACIEAEVGCHQYEPTLGGIALSAKVGANSCDAQCAGYDTFRQLESIFEPGIDPLHFVPSLADSCSVSEVGCSEFTNIDTRELGGEGLEYYTELRYCELPNEKNEKVYYSWEGSHTDGYVLRVHTLAQFYDEVNGDLEFFEEMLPSELAGLAIAGAPKYAARSVDELEDLHSRCNETSYAIRLSDEYAVGAADATCRALYDDGGQVYYRIIDEVTSVSNSCEKLRKTDTYLVQDEYLSREGQTTCERRGGLFDSDAVVFDGVTGACNVCRGGGIYDNGACIYQNIDGEGSTCRPSANSCRAYVGNTGTNVRRNSLGSFENTESTENWSSGTVVGESILVGFHSLQVAGETHREIDSLLLKTAVTDASYEISFWARGVPGKKIVTKFTQVGGVEAVFGEASVGNTWREYRVGPISAANIDLEATTTLQFEEVSGSTYFIDNIELHRTASYTYLINKSWRVPLVDDFGLPVIGSNGIQQIGEVPYQCDTTPDDAFAGEALGCREYTDENGNVETLTGFERLCRDKAQGCTAVYNTQNNDATGEVWYNTYCGRDLEVYFDRDFIVDNVCPINFYYFDEDDVFVAEPYASCIIPEGEDSCYIDVIEWPNTFHDSELIEASRETYYNKFVDHSTIIIPADTAEDAPLFLSNQPKFRCGGDAKGCEVVALETKLLQDASSTAGFSFDEMYIKNLPDSYDTVLCDSGSEGCSVFHSENETSYFKDPLLTGNSLCEYRDNVNTADGTRSGWYKTGVGACLIESDKTCTTDEQCTTPGDSCDEKASVGCYPDYLDLDGNFGIWSNETTDNYLGFVGSCDEKYHECTELVDRADVSNADPNGTPYYIIYNEDVKSGSRECDGISLKEGCVLLDNTEVPNKQYNTRSTYTDSRNKRGDKFGFVSPNTEGITDANVILKVERDRQCSEWLSCRKSAKQANDNGELVEVCEVFGLCTEAIPGGGCAAPVDSYNVGVCSTSKSQTCSEDSDCANVFGVCKFASNKLTADVYTSRDTSWFGNDYSGYSLLDTFSYSNLIYITLDSTDFTKYLAYRVPEHVFEFGEGEYADQGCLLDDGGAKDNWTSCGFANEGRCFTGICIAPVQGEFKASLVPSTVTTTGIIPGTVIIDETAQIKSAKESLIGGTCKVTPEKNAPHPPSVVITSDSIANVEDNFSASLDTSEQPLARYKYEYLQKRLGFTNVNVYQDEYVNEMVSEPEDAAYISSCIYTELTYQNGVKDFWPVNSADIVGICDELSPQENWGVPCTTDSQCSTKVNNDGTTTDTNIGTCSYVKQKQTFFGTEGFCLQRDLSRPINGGGSDDNYACLVWLPIDVSSSRFDVYNSDPNVGYQPDGVLDTDTDSSGQVYCIEGTNFSSGVLPDNAYNPEIPPSERNRIEEAMNPGGSAVRLNGEDYKSLDTALTAEMLEDTKAEIRAQIQDIAQGMDDGDEFNLCAVREGEDADEEFIIPEPALYYIACEDDCNDDGEECVIQEIIVEVSEDDGDITTNIDTLLEDDTSFDFINGFTDGGSGCGNTHLSLSGYPVLACGSPTSNPKKKRKIERSTCDTPHQTGITDSLYQELICNQTGGSNDTYDLLQTWVWDFLLKEEYGTMANPPKNAYVLRLEHATGVVTGKNTVKSSLKESPRENTDEDADRVADNKKFGIIYDDITAESVFALVPEHKDDETANGDVYMHPPRNWENDDRVLEERTPNEFSSGRLYTDSLGAEAVAGYESLLYTSPYQTILSENMIKKIYFVPLRIPGGNTDWTPQLLSRELYIDFESLRSGDPYTTRRDVNSIEGNTDGNEPVHFMEFPDKVDNDKAIFRNVKIDCSDGGFGNCEYPSGTSSSIRDTIATRYAMIFSGRNDTELGETVDSELLDPFNETDFTCGIDNWHAIGLDFNANGEFLGYISRSCTAERTARVKKRERTKRSSDSQGIQYAVVGVLNESCVEYAEVYSDEVPNSIFGTTNKAWTNKVWSRANTGDTLGGRSVESSNRPFASIPMTGDDMEGNARLGFAFHPALNAYGAPIACGDMVFGGRTSARALSFSDKFVCKALHPDNAETAAVTYSKDHYFKGGNPINDLYTFFSKVYRRSSIVSSTLAAGSDKSRTEGVLELLPPQVYAVNPITCSTGTEINREGVQSAAFSDACTAGPKNTLTINDKTGDITIDYDNDTRPDEDRNRDGQFDGLIGTGSYQAIMKFFAFADENRMPLRKVKIDWNDNGVSQLSEREGYFKNAKPYCYNVGVQNSACHTASGDNTQLTCRTDDECTDVDSDWSCETVPESFGNTMRACQSDYFQNTYTYNCSQTKAANEGVTAIVAADGNTDILRRLNQFGVEDYEKVCVFTPRVQVTDNWEWCNGTREQGYYNPELGACDFEDVAWTSFSESIIVIPR